LQWHKWLNHTECDPMREAIDEVDACRGFSPPPVRAPNRCRHFVSLGDGLPFPAASLSDRVRQTDRSRLISANARLARSMLIVT
jgi:hypothetical protein